MLTTSETRHTFRAEPEVSWYKLCYTPACLPQDAASEEDCTPDGRLPAAAAPFPAGEGERRPAGLSEVMRPGRAQHAT